MPEVLPLFDPGAAPTYTASAPVTGGKLVEVTGGRRVAHAGAASTKCVGVALNDAAAEALVPVQGNGVFRLRAAGAITAGDDVICAANGEIATVGAGTAFQVIGKALETVAGGADCQVLLKIA